MNNLNKEIISDNIILYKHVLSNNQNIIDLITNDSIKWKLITPTILKDMKDAKYKETTKNCYIFSPFGNDNNDLKSELSKMFPPVLACIKDFLVDRFVISWYDDIQILKYEKGNLMLEHYDSALNKKIKVSVFFYPNSNYEGGELVFTGKDITVKPPANSVIIFSSTEDNIHKVNPVLSGTKYTIATFIR